MTPQERKPPPCAPFPRVESDFRPIFKSVILDRYLNCQFRVLNSGRKDPPSFSSSRRCLNDYIFPRLEFCYSILSLWESYFPYPRNNFEFQRQYDTPYCSGRVQHLCFSSFQVGGCGFNQKLSVWQHLFILRPNVRLPPRSGPLCGVRYVTFSLKSQIYVMFPNLGLHNVFTNSLV